MFTAQLPSGDFIYLPGLNWKEIQQLPRMDYYCPDCKAPVILKRGNYKLPHFAHHSSCPATSLSPKETQHHLAGKRLFYDLLSDYFQQVHLEYYFCSIKQRADVCIEGGISLVIEFQCSAISASEVINRTGGYRQLGYDVRWFLHPQFLPVTRQEVAVVKLSQFLQSCIYTHKNLVQTLTFLNPDTKSMTVMILHHHLNQDYYVIEPIELKLDSGNFILQQPIPCLPNPQTVTKVMQEHYDRRKRNLFTYFQSKDWSFHFLVKKWKKTELTLPPYIGLPVVGSHNLGCEFLWQFKLVNYLVTCSQSNEPLTTEQLIENFYLSLPNRKIQNQESVQILTTYYNFLVENRLPEKPFYKSNSRKLYMEQWYRFQLLAKPSKH